MESLYFRKNPKIKMSKENIEEKLKEIAKKLKKLEGENVCLNIKGGCGISEEIKGKVLENDLYPHIKIMTNNIIRYIEIVGSIQGVYQIKDKENKNLFYENKKVLTSYDSKVPKREEEIEEILNSGVFIEKKL